MKTSTRGLAMIAAALTITTSAFAEEAKREGVIISQDGDRLNVRTREGSLTVIVTPSTKIEEDVGMSKRDRDTKSLINGLIIKAEGDLQGDTLTAEEIDFKQRDWRAAIASAAGTTEAFERQAAENAAAAAERAELRRAIIEGQEYVVQEETTVYFTTGSSAIAPQYQHALRALAQKAPSHGNYRISIIGFADHRGNPQANERLSLKRAIAVSNFMRQTGLIQPGRVLSPTAMGEGANTPDIPAPTSDDQARRVVARVVTAKTQLRE
jgi:outer membrane protein OmpA-like peptidoglycan-associated protein